MGPVSGELAEVVRLPETDRGNMTQRNWYTRKGDRRINPEHVIVKGKPFPTGFYGGYGTGEECPDCHTVLSNDCYSEPGKIHPQAEFLVSANVVCKECGSEFELLYRPDDDIGGGIEIARKELQPIQMANVLFTKAVVDGVRDLEKSLQEDVLDAIVRRCDEQHDQTSDREPHKQYLGYLVQGLKMLLGQQ